MVRLPKLNKDYKFIADLGEGSQARVSLYLEKDTKRQVAVKTFKILRNSDREGVIREVNILRLLSDNGTCFNIPYVLAVYEDDIEFHLVTSYIHGCTLGDSVQPGRGCREEEALDLMWQMLNTLRYI